MKDSFYLSGLRFECQKCSRCCRHDPGYVYLSENDIHILSSYFKMPRDRFIETYCRTVQHTGELYVSLKEKDNYDCIFWESGACTVYPVRPFQCRSYPFWSNYLASEDAWNETAKSCPGINRGRLYTFEEIEGWINSRNREVYRLQAGV